jgi:hypothetical protein
MLATINHNGIFVIINSNDVTLLNVFKKKLNYVLFNWVSLDVFFLFSWLINILKIGCEEFMIGILISMCQFEQTHHLNN